MSKAHGYHRFSDLVFVPMAECGEDCEIHQYERDDAAREVYRTKSGKVITDEMIEQWAAEAERGYDLPAETGKPEKVCIGCESLQGQPHLDWCPVMTGTLRSLSSRDRDAR